MGDYSAGVNHSLPTYGYARQYSGVNLGSFMKHITSSEVTEQGVAEVGYAVMELARCEGLDAHRRAMELRLEKLGLVQKKTTQVTDPVLHESSIADETASPESVGAKAGLDV